MTLKIVKERQILFLLFFRCIWSEKQREARIKRFTGRIFPFRSENFYKPVYILVSALQEELSAIRLVIIITAKDNRWQSKFRKVFSDPGGNFFSPWNILDGTKRQFVIISGNIEANVVNQSVWSFQEDVVREYRVLWN